MVSQEYREPARPTLFTASQSLYNKIIIQAFGGLSVVRDNKILILWLNAYTISSMSMVEM